MSGFSTIVTPVSDLDAAKAVYTALFGSGPTTDSPYYVGWSVDGSEFGLDPNGHAQGSTAPTAFCHVDDIAATVEALTAAGAEVVNAPRDVGRGRQVATLKDTDGNVFGVLAD